MKKNIFIAASPLQLLNCIEASYFFKTKNNILLLLYTSETEALKQMKLLIDFVEWKAIYYIALPQKSLDKFFYSKAINSKLIDIQKEQIDKVFVGEYRSDHINHIVNTLDRQNNYLVDDGAASLFYHENRVRSNVKKKITQLIYRLFFYKLNSIDYTFFTFFDIKGKKIYKNNYTFFKKYLSEKEHSEKVYFIGQPLVELGIMTKINYKNELRKVIKFYGNKEFTYILHRRQDTSLVHDLSMDLNFQYKRLDNLIELEMILAKSVPSNFATFYSTAIMILPQLLKDSTYHAFKIDNQFFEETDLYEDRTLDNYYVEFSKHSIQVESL